MILGIDASNVRAGGGLTHLRELLANAAPEEVGFDKVIVWGGLSTLERLGPRSWLDLRHMKWLDRPLPARLAWQHIELPLRATRDCNVLFSPGGLAITPFRPRVLVSQNLLPFEQRERERYGVSLSRLRLELLSRGQATSFAHADGVIFLSEYARRTVTARLGRPPARSATIPHGVDPRFRRAPTLAASGPLRVLYVSTVSPYKHPWNVVEAVGALRREGLPLSLELAGGSDHPASLQRLIDSIQANDPTGEQIRYLGLLPFEGLHAAYHRADLFAYASSCENLPNILIEAMASGLPIASSDRGPMREVLGDAGLYFDPESPAEIATALRTLVMNPALRFEMAQRAYERSAGYSWNRCARETLSFIADVARGSRRAPSVGSAFTAMRAT